MRGYELPEYRRKDGKCAHCGKRRAQGGAGVMAHYCKPCKEEALQKATRIPLPGWGTDGDD